MSIQPQNHDQHPAIPRIPLTTGWGVALAFGVAFISGVSVFINSYAVKQVPDAAVYTTLKNGVAAADPDRSWRRSLWCRARRSAPSTGGRGPR